MFSAKFGTDIIKLCNKYIVNFDTFRYGKLPSFLERITRRLWGSGLGAWSDTSATERGRKLKKTARLGPEISPHSVFVFFFPCFLPCLLSFHSLPGRYLSLCAGHRSWSGIGYFAGVCCPPSRSEDCGASVRSRSPCTIWQVEEKRAAQQPERERRRQIEAPQRNPPIVGKRPSLATSLPGENGGVLV